MENTKRQGWSVSTCGVFFEHETGLIRVNRSYDNIAKRPFCFAVKSQNGFWIRAERRNFKNPVSAMKAAESCV